MNAAQIIQSCDFDGVRLAITPEGGLHYSGDPETVREWLPILRANKAAILEELRRMPLLKLTEIDPATAYAELTANIHELCRIAGYSDEARERMLSAMRNLHPYRYAEEAAYFRLQVERAKAGTYWDGNASPEAEKRSTEHPRKAA